MFDQTRLANKINAARSQFNNVPIDNMAAALQKIADDEAKAIIEEIKFAKVTVPGAGLVVGTNPVTGQSITGNLT